MQPKIKRGITSLNAERLSEHINGLDASRIEQFVTDLKGKQDVVRAVNGPWRSRVKWQGGLRTKAYMRSHTVNFDEPGDLGASDTAASGHEHLLSAVGACILTGFVFQATRMRIRIYDAEISMEGTFGNIKNWAGLEDESTPGYPEIQAKLHVKADAPRKTIKHLWDEAVKRSVVAQTVSRGAKITPSIHIL